MPGEPVRGKEWLLVTCRDWRQRRRQTRDKAVLPSPTAAASRRVWLSDVPINKATCFCPALFPAGRRRMRGSQKACPLVRVAPSILSARELHKRLRFPWLHLLSTIPFHFCVEPLPNVRDGILVERLVKTVRYVADMRRCQYVAQRPEGVRRRQRLDVEYVDRRAGDLLVLQRADQSLLFDDRSARRIDQPGRWLHSLQLCGPYQAARTAAQHQMDRQDIGPLEDLVLGNKDCARGFGGLGRHVLAPGNQIHSKSAPDPRDL